VLQATLESVALGFLEIYHPMSKALGEPKTIVASGAALLQSPAWTQMIADALSFPITTYPEPEASSRGAALLALERLGIVRDLSDTAPRWGTVHKPKAALETVYGELLASQQKVFKKLFPEN